MEQSNAAIIQDPGIPQFTLLITTKNRRADLKITLSKINHLLLRKEVLCIICDDGSTDDSSLFIENEYPEIQLIKNEKSRGLIYSRNRLLALVRTDFAISLDDDAHFLTDSPLSAIRDYFNKHPRCGLIALRIFWGLEPPESLISGEIPLRVRSFVGCAHVWRMSAWNLIPNYPEWFVFYGEEDFAAFQLFKKDVEVHYLPQVLVQHRVDIKSRIKNKDYRLRLRRSLRSGWYLYLLFYPVHRIPGIIVYSIWSQIKTKLFKGDWRTIFTIVGATCDVFVNSVRIFLNRNGLSSKEFDEFSKLPQTKIYWKPQIDNNQE